MTWFLAFLFSCHAYGDLSPLSFTPNINQIDPGYQVEYFEDKKGEFSINAVLGPTVNWRQAESKVPNFGFTPSVYWFRFIVSQENWESDTLLLKIGYSALKNVEVFVVKNKAVVSSDRIGSSSFTARPLNTRGFVFPISLDRGISSIYLRVHSPYHTVQVPITLYRAPTFWEEQEIYDLLEGLYLGIITGMIFYNFFLFTSIKKIEYFYYCSFIAGNGLFQIGIGGLGYQYIWSESPEWEARNLAVIVPLITVFSCPFILNFLSLKENGEFTYRKLLIASWIAAVFFSLFAFFKPHPQVITYSIVNTVFNCTLCWSIGITLWKKGFRPAKFFTIAWSIFLWGTIIRALNKFGLIPINHFTENIQQVGAIFEVTLLSFALGDKIQMAQQAAQKKIEDLNRELTTKVDEIKILNTQLIDNEKARTTFFHNTSHELRTPLNGIIAFASLLQKGHYGALPHRVIAQMTKIRSLANSLLNQVNTILDLARSKRGELKIHTNKIELQDLASELKITCESIGIKYPQTSYEILPLWPADESPIFVGDREKIISVARILISNAFKFCSPNHQNLVKISLCRDSSGSLAITISDQGIGFDQKESEKIFEEFGQLQMSDFAWPTG